ncbi:hypothetical protein L596_029875 [Steinernema carpocapsae]|uniref:CRAL-TRIO domain-containing protein n=1 Tax=Steinernema carpocapsae TaxID=34508 RepID=A0A4U5LR15_STECR|nr:hypothetical protein L596_029875 [Steinernema carpocapsae]
MSHYVTAEEITPEMREKIEELRSRCKPELEKYPPYNTDFTLLRWLMGWDYDVETIIPKLKFCLDTLHSLGLHKVTFETTDEINGFIKSQSPAAEYFPGGFMGYDKDGNVIAVHALAKTHPKTLSYAGRVSDLMRLCIAEGELAFKLIRKKEAEMKKKLGVKIIVDLEDFSMDLMYPPALKAYLNLVTLLQAMFPDFARNIYVINCPAMLSVAYATIHPVLSKQTREKVQFLGADWKQKLVEEFGAENVYPYWGGSKPLPPEANGRPTGPIRMGGKVPDEIRYENRNDNDLHNKPLSKINIGARSSKKLEVEIEKPGLKLKWMFKDGSYVWPRFRITTEFVPEYGCIECEESGIYEIEFGNDHGKVWSKDLKYVICVE